MLTYLSFIGKKTSLLNELALNSSKRTKPRKRC